MKKILFISMLLIVFLAGTSYAENFKFDVHSGYGVLKFKEKENFHGDNFDSDFRHKAILLGLSGEYTFPKHENLYAGINADWVILGTLPRYARYVKMLPCRDKRDWMPPAYCIM